MPITYIPPISGSGLGDLLAANNLSDVSDAATSRTNLGLAIGSNVQAFDADLAAIASLGLTQNGFWLRAASGAGVADKIITVSSDFSLAGDTISLANSYQASDADLTSWAGVTRASGFDTFTATPSSANLRSLLTDETGTGAAVFATSPTLVTPTLGVATATSVAVDDEAYDEAGWNGDLTVPTKNAVRDAIEAIEVGGGFDEGGDYEPTGTWDWTGATLTFGTISAMTITTANVTNLKILDNVDQSHGLVIVANENLSADRNLSIVTGNAHRQITLSGDVTLPAGTALVSGGNAGTPSALVGTNISGTASALNIGGSAASLSVSGQTGLITFTGLASTNRAKTVRDAADTILELGGSYTPTGNWTNMVLITPALGTPSAGVLTNCTNVTHLRNTAGSATLSSAGQVNVNTTNKAIGIHNGSKEVALSLIQHREFSFDPKAVCDGAVDRLFLFTVGNWAPFGITITAWRISFEADPTTEVDLDLKRADAFIGVANSAVMDALDTTTGAASEGTAANINGGAVVANGKVVYLEFGTAYTEANHQIIFEIEFEIEED